MAADLHCHTKMSDGTVSIEELVLLAKKRGLSAVAITDRDTFAGDGRAVIFGKRKGIEVIPGAEFTTIDDKTGRKVNILCYYCP
ncbi:MAG TPA: PHP domain-containing protein, partial [Ruminococcaceae bacterium]|nr:PHP domain-containing protein [Oscillospiraceae bacterium]